MEDTIDMDSLIPLVEARPVLLHKWHRDYKCVVITKIAWEGICKKLNPRFDEMSQNDKTKFYKKVLSKWVHVRASFRQALKNNRKYVFDNQLQFLVKVLDVKADDDDSLSALNQEESSVSFRGKINREISVVEKAQASSQLRKMEREYDATASNGDSSADNCSSSRSPDPSEQCSSNISVKIEQEDTYEDTDSCTRTQDPEMKPGNEFLPPYVKTEVKEEENLIIEDDEQGCRLWIKEPSDPSLLYPNVSLQENDPPPAKKIKLCSFSKAESTSRNKDRTTEGSSTKPATPDDFEALSEVWASKLRGLDETQKVLAEDLINQILKKGFFKELTRNTVVDKVS